MARTCILTDLTDEQLGVIADIIGEDPFVEIGCGDGYYADRLQKITNNEAYAIDCHPECWWDDESKVNFKHAYFDDWVVANQGIWKKCKTVLLFYPSTTGNVAHKVIDNLQPSQLLILIAPKPYNCGRFAGTELMWKLIVDNTTCLRKIDINGIDFMYVISAVKDLSERTKEMVLCGYPIFGKKADGDAIETSRKLAELEKANGDLFYTMFEKTA